MFINLKEGKLTLYDLVISKKFNQTFEKMSYDGEKVHHSFTATHWCGEGRSGNKISRFMTYRKTGKVIEYNDFYSNDEDEYLVEYDLYTLPELYLIIEQLKADNYKFLEELSKYYRDEIDNSTEKKIFSKYYKQINSYIYIRKILETDPAAALEMIKVLKSHARGTLKTNLNNINQYLNINTLSLDGIKVKEKKNEK